MLGVLPGLIGTIRATGAIKLILGAGDSLAGRLLLFDALAMSVRTMKLRRDPACPICGDNPPITALIDYEQFCGVTSATQVAATPAAAATGDTTVEELKARLDRRDPIWILDVREPREFEICRIPGSTLIPLGDLPKRLSEIPQGPGAPDVVVHCKMGGRSARPWRAREGLPGRSLTRRHLAWIVASTARGGERYDLNALYCAPP